MRRKTRNISLTQSEREEDGEEERTIERECECKSGTGIGKEGHRLNLRGGDRKCEEREKDRGKERGSGSH